jgi:hypothetical protein
MKMIILVSLIALLSGCATLDKDRHINGRQRNNSGLFESLDGWMEKNDINVVFIR